VKLKTFLLVDLLIVATAVGVYFYLQDQGVITGAAKPATFVYSDLVVDPLEAYVGQTIHITVNVTNIGDIEGNVTVNLEINDNIKDSQNITLPGLKSSEIVEFSNIELKDGIYNVKIADLTGNFTIKPAPPESSKIVLSNFKSDPYEAWPTETIIITADAFNPSSEADLLMITLTDNDQPVDTQLIELEAGEGREVVFNLTAGDEGKHIVKLNTLSGTYTVVKEGYHTLIIGRSGGGSKTLPLNINGQNYATTYQALVPVGTYTVTVPNPFDVGTGVLAFSYWSDGSTSATKTFTVDKRTVLVVTYTLVSGYASCPSLYTWNGTGYSYVTDVSNPGWLGYIGHIDSDGNIIFNGGNPYDYVKLDQNQLAANNGYFDLMLTQQWDELFYLDQTCMLVVDHPADTDVYTSMTNYLNKGSTGQIYTTATGPLRSPISAVNEKGQNVLPALLEQDGNYTPGINGNDSPAWNNITQNQLTIDLGDLTGASEIKLVVTGMVDWGAADTYYNWIDQFKEAAAMGFVSDGTAITPSPRLEVMDADGNWMLAPQTRQIPLPSDYNARTFTVDLTGLFPADVTNYKVRFTNFWNVTYDYIGIDTTPQQDITITTLKPTTATLQQLWDTQSTASGAFTRYGDVTTLVQDADDMFVVGRQGDQVHMLYSTENLSDPEPGMVRDYFFAVACWFKDPPEEWGYGFSFTVDPLPFMNMTGFPYTTAENYPTDAAHQAYIAQYNTRIFP